MKISVVIPVYNKAGRIKRTIESILSQDFDDFEIIMVDDKSQDSSVEIIKQELDERIKKVEWHCFEEVDSKFIENVQKDVKKAGLKESDFIIIKY